MTNLHNTQSTSVHLVLGAGQIGTRVTDLLLAKGLRVRQVRLGAKGSSRPGLEWASGDITNPEFAREVGRDVAVVYDCMNPPYHRWPELLLPIATGGLRAAEGKKLVALDCVYMYGRPSAPMTEETPMTPVSKKGELRVKLSELRLSAHQRGDVQVAIGRASDFVGANLPYSLFSDRFFSRITRGRTAETFGNPDLPHSYTYADDIARALVTLGERDEALGQVWHLPTAAAESTRALMARIGAEMGLKINVKSLSRLEVRAVGLFMPMMRELHEMIYQWEVPFIIDDSKYRRVFGEEATPLAEIARETAAWAKRTYALAG